MTRTPDRSVNSVSHKLPVNLTHDERRVILLPFGLGETRRIRRVFRDTCALSVDHQNSVKADIMATFYHRHKELKATFDEHYKMAAQIIEHEENDSETVRFIIGAYFTMEYSIEGAALFNPSIVAHPRQDDMPEGSVRFVMSLRATGEGHISSIVFQTGTIDAEHNVSLNPMGWFASRTRLAPVQNYVKELFSKKLNEMDVNISTANMILTQLPANFALSELGAASFRIREEISASPILENTIEQMMWLARSNYELLLGPEDDISDLVMFPHSDNESRGIEDLRLVRFVDDDDSVTYFGTYTATSGEHILPMMLETQDFRRLKVHSLSGARVQNKGMALFPRKIGGSYVMCSRIDGQNLFMMESESPYFWETARMLARPKYPWELRIIGNCGSPMETSEGWLLLTHGVGPMRRYCIGAMLLDRDDPFRLIGRLRDPLITPGPDEREGYVPNVVYSCGGMIINDMVFIPYAIADCAATMATVSLDSLLDRLKHDGL